MKYFYYLRHNEDIEVMKNPKYYWKETRCERLNNNSCEDKAKVIAMYTYKKLYFIIKVNKTEFKNNDRAYQYGDGFNLVLAKPKEEASDEFYVIALSPFNHGRRVFIWYRNVDFLAQSIEKAEINMSKDGNYTYFSIAIPWEEIKPMNPFEFKEYGVNIAYYEDEDNKLKEYMLRYDPHIQEENQKRIYDVFKFEEKNAFKEVEVFATLNKNYGPLGSDFKIQLYINSPKAIDTSIQFNINSNLHERQLLIMKGRNKVDFVIAPKHGIIRGNNDFRVNLLEHSFQFKPYAYDRAYIMQMKAIARNAVGKNPDYKNTLEFLYKNAADTMKKLKSYDDFSVVKEEFLTLENLANRGEDNFINKGTVQRMAVKSSFDGELEPYSLYVPKSMKNRGIAGIIITLHGSGSDDRAAMLNPLNRKLCEDLSLVYAAPKGRGTSNCYCPKEALQDIKDITLRLKEVYNTDNVFLEGFSMGGYGVLRVFDYVGELYKGLAIFAGHPNLGPLFEICNGVDYTKNIDLFKDIPMIAFHGNKDNSCPYEEAAAFYKDIEKVNPNFNFYTVDGIGHEGLIEEEYNIYRQWLEHNLRFS